MGFEVSEYHHKHEFFDAISALRISVAPHLTMLELYYYCKSARFNGVSMSKDIILFSGSAPLLTRFVLCGVYVDWYQTWAASAHNPVGLEFAWHPENFRPSSSQFTTTLRGTSVLEKLTLRRPGPSGDFLTWIIEPTPGGLSDFNAPVQLPQVTERARPRVPFTSACHRVTPQATPPLAQKSRSKLEQVRLHRLHP